MAMLVHESSIFPSSIPNDFTVHHLTVATISILLLYYISKCLIKICVCLIFEIFLFSERTKITIKIHRFQRKPSVNDLKFRIQSSQMLLLKYTFFFSFNLFLSFTLFLSLSIFSHYTSFASAVQKLFCFFPKHYKNDELSWVHTLPLIAICYIWIIPQIFITLTLLFLLFII